VPALFFKMDFFVDLTSVGTFFAFILVCGGVLYMDKPGLSKDSKFRVPYINGKDLVGLSFAVGFVCVMTLARPTVDAWISLGLGVFLADHSLVLVFWGTWLTMSILSFKHNFSLLPVIGILINLYLMSELGASNWIIFVIWLAVGLLIYFLYGYKHSKLRKE